MTQDSAIHSGRELLVHQSHEGYSSNRERIRRDFWPKLLRVAGKIPFAEDAAALWYCAKDPRTPFRVRAILVAAIAYFVMPVDFIPDVIVGLGYGDDALVISTALSMVSQHVKARHRAAARRALGLDTAS